MSEKKALVKNAASEKQVGNAKQMSKVLEDQELNDLRSILDTDSGRRFMWKALAHCGIYNSPYAHSGSEQNRNIGRGDVGRWLLSEIITADQKSWLKMQNENLKQGEINV